MLRLAVLTFNSHPDAIVDVVLVCDEMKLGFMTMLAGTHSYNYGVYQSIADSMMVPLVDWEVSDVRSADAKRSPMTFSVRPPIDQLLVDYIKYKGWSHVVYIHDGANAHRTLHGMFEYLNERSPEYNLFVDNFKAPAGEEFFRDFLNDLHRRLSLSLVRNENLSNHDSTNVVSPVHVIVDLEGGFRMEMFLRALHESVLVKKEYHYVFANFASTAFAHDALLVAGAALDRTMKKHGFTIFDRSFSRYQLFNRGLPGLYCRPHEDRDYPDRPFQPFEFGEEIAESIKEVVLTSDDGTLTGRIQFDPHTGFRTNFSATIIEIRPDVNSLSSVKKRFQWAQGKGFLLDKQQISQEGKQNKSVTQKGILTKKSWELRLNVVTVLVKPFVMLRRSNPGEPKPKGNDRFEGYCIDLLKLLAKNISGFEYDIFVSEGNKYGARQADGSWDGMLGYLLNETADIAVAPLTITQERERAVDFSKPFMTTGISIMIKKPEKQEFNIFSFMEPLGMRIWILTVCSYVGVSLTIFIVSSFSPYEQRVQFNRGEFSVSNEFSMYNSLWFTLAAFMQQGTDILPKALSGRIASSAWWFFTLIIVSSYTANLAAFLTLEKMTPPIESVEDLANQKKIRYGVVKGGSTAAFFEDSTVPLYKKMWDFMQDENNKFMKGEVAESVFVDTYAEGIERVRNSKGLYAFLLEETTNNYESGRKPCNTMKVGQNLNTLGYGIATKIGNPLRQAEWGALNLATLYLQEKGELKRLENKWWYDRGQCDQGISVSTAEHYIYARLPAHLFFSTFPLGVIELEKRIAPIERTDELMRPNLKAVVDSGASSSLNLSKVAGIFYILMSGMVLSMLAALVEFLIRKKKENKEKVTVRVTRYIILTSYPARLRRNMCSCLGITVSVLCLNGYFHTR
uniref:Glutamate receptor ionotropic, kainate 2 n=1 Tax=Angiostrongylus cantonensis TaxID=6313 RepID=A0A158P968_ANGCA